jgi:hypothetical protein
LLCPADPTSAAIDENPLKARIGCWAFFSDNFKAAVYFGANTYRIDAMV